MHPGLAGAANTPNATTLSITENAGSVLPELLLDLDMTLAFPLVA
ncbi:MAG: hypothetical protein ACREDD_08995 [Methylocella sp.]